MEPSPLEPTPFERVLYAIRFLPRWQKFMFFFFAALFLVSSFAILKAWNDRYLVEVPDKGGAIVEGVIGRPRFINPVLAKSDVDRDMTQLIFSGLMRATPEGSLRPDLAREYTVSDDGLTYTFTLRDNLFWHDGEPLTSADVVFTIEKVQDKTLEIKSPKRASWEGVIVKAPNERTVEFSLKQPYAPFLENTTIGIIPKHIWGNVPNAEFDVSFHNVEPIGSGPYRIENVVYEKDQGLPIAYELRAFKHYALGEPYLSKLTMRFYGNNAELVSAYKKGTIQQIHTIDPRLAEELEHSGAIVSRTELPRVFAAFFNQSTNPALAAKEVRQALSAAIDRDRIVRDVLYGFGKSVSGPMPYEVSTSSLRALSSAPRDERLTTAKAMLIDAGWKENAETGILEKTDPKKKTVIPLQFSLAVSDIDELKRAAELITEDWRAIGADVNVKVYESSTFTTEVLTPRAFDVLFFGQVIGRIPDLYPYWHSSQRAAPGLNIAQYTSRPVDKLLEDLRKTRDQEERMRILRNIEQEIATDAPAAFVYSSYFLYVRDPRVRGVRTGVITTESERFLDISDWHIESDHIWGFLVPYFDRKPLY